MFNQLNHGINCRKNNNKVCNQKCEILSETKRAQTNITMTR